MNVGADGRMKPRGGSGTTAQTAMAGAAGDIRPRGVGAEDSPTRCGLAGATSRDRCFRRLTCRDDRRRRSGRDHRRRSLQPAAPVAGRRRDAPPPRPPADVPPPPRRPAAVPPPPRRPVAAPGSRRPPRQRRHLHARQPQRAPPVVRPAPPRPPAQDIQEFFVPRQEDVERLGEVRTARSCPTKSMTCPLCRRKERTTCTTSARNHAKPSRSFASRLSYPIPGCRRARPASRAHGRAVVTHGPDATGTRRWRLGIPDGPVSAAFTGTAGVGEGVTFYGPLRNALGRRAPAQTIATSTERSSCGSTKRARTWRPRSRRFGLATSILASSRLDLISAQATSAPAPLRATVEYEGQRASTAMSCTFALLNKWHRDTGDERGHRGALLDDGRHPRPRDRRRSLEAPDSRRAAERGRSGERRPPSPSSTLFCGRRGTRTSANACSRARRRPLGRRRADVEIRARPRRPPEPRWATGNGVVLRFSRAPRRGTRRSTTRRPRARGASAASASSTSRSHRPDRGTAWKS